VACGLQAIGHCSDTCQPVIVTAGAQCPGIGCRLPWYDTLRIKLADNKPILTCT